VAKPFLDLCNVSFVIESIRSGRRAQRVHTKTINLSTDAGFPRIFADDVFKDRAAVERLLERRAMAPSSIRRKLSALSSLFFGIRDVREPFKFSRGYYRNPWFRRSRASDSSTRH
jgi:hypothetical protein